MNSSYNIHNIKTVTLYHSEQGNKWLQFRSTDYDTITIHFDTETIGGWSFLLEGRLRFGETLNLKTGEITKE